MITHYSLIICCDYIPSSMYINIAHIFTYALGVYIHTIIYIYIYIYYIYMCVFGFPTYDIPMICLWYSRGNRRTVHWILKKSWDRNQCVPRSCGIMQLWRECGEVPRHNREKSISSNHYISEWTYWLIIYIYIYIYIHIWCSKFNVFS